MLHALCHFVPLCLYFCEASLPLFYSGRLTPVRFGSLDVSWSLICMYKQDTSPLINNHKGRSPHHNWESPGRPRLSFQRVLRPLCLCALLLSLTTIHQSLLSPLPLNTSFLIVRIRPIYPVPVMPSQ